MKNKIQGFSLLELLVVILIIGILAAIALPQYQRATEKAKMAEAVIMLKAIAEAQQRYYMVHNKYLTCTQTDQLDIDFDGTTNCTYSFCKCKQTDNFAYMCDMAAGGDIAFAQRLPYYKYYMYITQQNPSKIRCNYTGTNPYQPSRIQKELCDKFDRQGTL